MNVAGSYNNLGIVARHQGECEEAKAYYQKALKIKVSELEEDHVDVANSYNNLGAVSTLQFYPRLLVYTLSVALPSKSTSKL